MLSLFFSFLSTISLFAIPILAIAPISDTSILGDTATQGNTSIDGQILQLPTPPVPPLIANYTPEDWIPSYNKSYCPASTTPIYIDPVLTIFPFSPQSVFEIAGDFDNITWITSAFNDTTSEGPPDVPGNIRTEPKDPFGAVEILTNYAVDNDTAYGLYNQQASRLGKPILVAPGLLEIDSHAVIELRPACDQQGTSFGFYLTYCFDTATMGSTPGFNLTEAEPKLVSAIMAGTGGGLSNFWKMLDWRGNTPFNSTATCEQVADYIGQGQDQ